MLQIMQPSTIRKLCASVIALLIVTQASAHLDRLLSQEMLDYIGYYDNLVSSSILFFYNSISLMSRFL